MRQMPDWRRAMVGGWMVRARGHGAWNTRKGWPGVVFGGGDGNGNGNGRVVCRWRGPVLHAPPPSATLGLRIKRVEYIGK